MLHTSNLINVRKKKEKIALNNISTGGKKIRLDNVIQRHPFLSLSKGIKRGRGDHVVNLSVFYPFFSAFAYPAYSLTYGLYPLYPLKSKTCTLVQLPSSFSLYPSSPLRPQSVVVVLHPRAHAILQASSAVLPPKPYVFCQPAAAVEEKKN